MEVLQNHAYPDELEDVYQLIKKGNLLQRYVEAVELIESELGIEVGSHDVLELDQDMAGISDSYIDRLRRNEDSEEIEPRIDGEMVTAGGTLEAVRTALDGEDSYFVGGGAHHASRGEASGYNLFNDIGIALETVREDEDIGNISIIDLDVHHPDGTARMYRLDPEVQIFSVHGWGIFPGTGWMHDNGTGEAKGTHINIPLPDNTSGVKYNDILERSLENALDEHEPELVIYLAGTDVYRLDDVGNLKLNAEEIHERDRIVKEATEGIPTATLAGGGYNSKTPELYTNTVAALTGNKSITEEERDFRDKEADERAEERFQELSTYLKSHYDIELQ